jgi:hypothetical protein
MTRQRPKKKREAFTFIANIPFQIEAEWNREFAYLAGFPVQLVYTGMRAARTGGAPRVATACYWFDPGTYREDELVREMRYHPYNESFYSVRVTVRKDTGEWETFKYHGEQLLYVAHGPDFYTTMLQTLLVGLHSDEPENDPRKPPGVS